MTPGFRLLTALLGGVYLLKAVALAARGGTQSAGGLAAFLFTWPGVIPNHFRQRRAAQPIDPASYMAAWARMIVGISCIVLLGIYAPGIPDGILGLAGMGAILLTVHLGICNVLPWLLRWAGFPVPLLFDRPWASRTLAEFWGRRWNLAFVEMNQRLFARPMLRRFGKQGSRLGIFALSGILHELALSFPAGGGWGLPAAYFLLHGALVAVEERFRIANRVWTLFWVLVPAPWLFHESFRRALIVPFYQWLHGLLVQHTWEWYLSNAIYAAAIGQLLVLIASFQAPTRLGWKHDIPKLTRFNQKVFWVYAFYILLCIVSFAILTWRLQDSFLAGEPAARALAVFIAVFWTVRVLIDVFWYDHRDWPSGNSMVAGHALVTSLFCSLAGIYWLTALR